MLSLSDNGRGLYDITTEISDWVGRQDIAEGMLTVFCRHTSASLVIQENADPDVLRDLESFFRELVREDPRLYRHTVEGSDDMPAHIRCVLTNSDLSIPLTRGRLALGTWQGIYLFEHRNAPHGREVMLHLMGE